MKRSMSSVIIVLFASLFAFAIDPNFPIKPAKGDYRYVHNKEEVDAKIKMMKAEAQLQKEQETEARLREMKEKDRLKNEQLAAELKKTNLEAAAKAKDPNNIKNMTLTKKIAILEARVKMLEERIQRLENIHPDNNPDPNLKTLKNL